LKKVRLFDDYYLKNNTEYLKEPEIKKYDPEWDQEEWDDLEARMSKKPR
jgi:hypothetical protein|tara:strand:- start:156 stop:302 length:147 start_codon:yes stop_codon:yes gene_type:complete